MTRVVIHTQKGGVGKTTTAINLAAALRRHGHGERVFLADLDPQQHLTAMILPPSEEEGAAVPFDAGLGIRPVTGETGVFLLPGPSPTGDQVFAIPRDLHADWTIVDTPPNWSPRLAEASLWADVILCPLEPDFLGMSGIGRLLDHIEAHGWGQEKLRFLLTRFNARLALHREVKDRLAARFGDQLLDVEIRNSVKLAEAPGMGRTVFAHAPRSTGSTDYRALAAALDAAQHSGKAAA
jgi:chromosome partitioning protein